MKIFHVSMILVLFVVSCVGKEVKSNLNVKQTLKYPELVDKQLSKFPLKEPNFAIDSSYFATDSSFQFKKGNLSLETVKALSHNLSKDEITEREKYYLNDFFLIQKSKNSGKYADFKRHLDIGMTENAVCNAIGRVEFGDTAAILLWEIHYKSYDACPYYFGHDVMGSLVKNGKIMSCITLAVKQSGADAPMFYEMFQLVKIKENGQIFIQNYGQTTEENKVIERSKNSIKYKLNSFGFEWQK